MAAKPRFDGEWVPLTNLCRPKQWKTIPKTSLLDHGYPVYGANGVIGYYDSYNHENETILIGCRGTCGQINVCRPQSYVTGNAMCLDDLDDAVNIKYLELFLKSFDFSKIIGGTSQPQITKQGLSRVLVPIKPPDEQLVIAERLEYLRKLNTINVAKMSALDALVKSRFVEMFGEESSIEKARLKDVCSIITDGTHQPPKFQNDGIPFLFVSNIAGNELTYKTTKYISQSDYESLIARTPIEIGDVLVSAVGSFGHPAIVKEERPFCFQRHIAYLKPLHDRIDSTFLHAALLADDSQRYMDKAAKGVAQRTVTLKSFKELAIPLPPLALQQEFADFVAQVDKSRFVDALESDQRAFSRFSPAKASRRESASIVPPRRMMREDILAYNVEQRLGIDLRRSS